MKKNNIISNIYIVLLLFIIYIPIVIVVIYSFNASKIDAKWAGFTLDWYIKLFKNRSLMEALRNSIIVAVLSCSVSAIIGTVGAVGMARVDFKTKSIIESIATIPIMIPEIILGMVFLAFFSFIKLPFGMLTLVLAHTTFCIPYIFIIVKGRLVGIDKSIGEAARDLGASETRMFFDITLPLISPAILSGTLLAFAMSLDDVVISFFVTGAKTNTLPIKVYSQIKMGVTPEINALCTLMLLVTFVLIFISIKIGNTKKSNNYEEKNS